MAAAWQAAALPSFRRKYCYFRVMRESQSAPGSYRPDWVSRICLLAAGARVEFVRVTNFLNALPSGLAEAARLPCDSGGFVRMLDMCKRDVCDRLADGAAGHEPVGSSEMMRAMAAACAILAIADGNVAPDEGRRLFRAICDYGRVSGFSDTELLRELAVHERNFAADAAAAHAFAAAQIRPIARQRQAALRLLDACRFLVIADGIARLREFRAILKIRLLLRLDRDRGNPLLSGQGCISDPPRLPAVL